MPDVSPRSQRARRLQSIGSPGPSKRAPVVTETSWSARRLLTPAEWARAGRFLGTIARSSGWWIGDWIRYGNARYGEKYEAAAKITGYDVQSLMNMAYVASRFEISRRREKLSFSHHGEVAALPSDQQDLWLDRAEREALSVHALRVQLKRSATGLAPPRSVSATGVAASDGHPSAANPEIVCPECGHHFHPRAKRPARKSPEGRR
jgi:hypothetical protein